MKQNFILESSERAFKEKVDSFLEEGYNLVPGTVAVSITEANERHYPATYFSAVLRKEEKNNPIVEKFVVLDDIGSQLP